VRVSLRETQSALCLHRSSQGALWGTSGSPLRPGNLRQSGGREALLRLQNELPTLWFVTPIEAWIATFGQRADKLARRLAEHGLPSGLALTITANALAQIVDLQPGLRMHTQAVFLLTCHAGDLDQTLVDRLCRRAERTLLELANDLVPGGSALRTCSQLRIEIFAPNAENDPGRASIHSLKDR
jgi:hypothetical protein